MNKFKLTAWIVTGLAIQFSCQMPKQEEKKDSSAPIEKVEKQSISYRILDHVFVKNDVKEIQSSYITKQEEFDKVFGMATTMGENGKPILPDFTKEHVIVVIKPETANTGTPEPVELVKNETGELQFTYRYTKGDSQSFSIRPFLAIVFSKKDSSGLKLVEIN